MTKVTVDINGAADLMQIHPKTVLDLINAGTLPAGRVGRAYVLMTKDVLAYVEQQIVQQTAARLSAKGIRTRGIEVRRRRRLTPRI